MEQPQWYLRDDVIRMLEAAGRPSRLPDPDPGNPVEWAERKILVLPSSVARWQQEAAQRNNPSEAVRRGFAPGGGTATKVPNPAEAPWRFKDDPLVDTGELPDALVLVVQQVERTKDGKVSFQPILLRAKGLADYQKANPADAYYKTTGGARVQMEVFFVQKGLTAEFRSRVAAAAVRETLHNILTVDPTLPSVVLDPSAEKGSRNNPLQAPEGRGNRF